MDESFVLTTVIKTLSFSLNFTDNFLILLSRSFVVYSNLVLNRKSFTELPLKVSKRTNFTFL